jgi:hypothetical protein
MGSNIVCTVVVEKKKIRLPSRWIVMMPPTRGRTGGVVFRIHLGISGCWCTAREGGAWPGLEEGSGEPLNATHPWDQIHTEP